VSLRAQQEAPQRRMGLRLRHAMQVDAGINDVAATREFLPGAPINRRQ
jgi:hypothetical protein